MSTVVSVTAKDTVTRKTTVGKFQTVYIVLR
jgi:hypothetical protein